VATAEAGLTLSEFQNHLKEKGQWLPIDPPDDGTATLGGVVCNRIVRAAADGLRRPQVFRYRSARDSRRWRLIKAGGNVVKNVAGYDLCKLFTGSYGTLGLITEVTFKLRPLPAETRTIVASGPLTSLVKPGRTIARESFPVAVELLSGSLAKQLGISVEGRKCALLIRFAGSPRAVVTETASALKKLREQNIRCVTHDEDDELWLGVSRAATRGVNDLSWRVLVRAGDLSSFIEEVVSIEEDDATQVELQWQAGLGDGRLRAMTRVPVYHREAVRALERLRQRAENLAAL